MGMRERLNKLLREGIHVDAEKKEAWILGGKVGKQPDIFDNLADHLIANGVTIPVRCKDCASFEETYRTVGEETGNVYCGGYCYHWDYEQGMSPNQVYGDDFCCHGERRTDE